METGRVIHRRYLLQRLIQQGQACVVYQGVDQVLQRAVAIKVAPVQHVAAYRAAIRVTSQFAHPNIIGLYDLIVEPETIYIVQEYVDGDDFPTLLQSQLAPYYVVDMGVQICQALMYAGSGSRKMCHGDLTPAAIIRDRRGQVRVNNFALPPDLAYFTAWSAVGANATAVSDPQLPAGQASSGRRSDDTRAVGLLLYQLLAGRTPDARTIEPPADGRLRFMRNAPPELCEVIARAVMRQHPQYIATPDALYAELKPLSEALEPASPVSSVNVAAVQEPPVQFSPVRSGAPAGQPPGIRLGGDNVPRVGATNARLPAMEQVQEPATTAASSAPEMQGMSAHLTAARQAAYPNSYVAPQEQPKRINIPLLLLVGLILFALFFGIGYYLSTVFIK